GREILTLGQYPHAEVLGQPLAFGHRRRPAAVVAQDVVVLGVESRIGPRRPERRLQLEAGWHQRLGHEPPAELTEPPRLAGVSHQHWLAPRHPWLVARWPPASGERPA